MDFENSHLFLFLNASIVWFVISAILMKVCRLKSLVIVLLIAPYVIGSTFRHIAGMPQLIGFYGTSMIYGALGIVGGMLYVEYARAKAYLQKASKFAFVARGAVALSSIYLLSFFAQRIVASNPMVQLLLNWIEGGDRAREILSQTNYDGAMIAGAGIVAGSGTLAVLRYREHRSTSTSRELQEISGGQ